MPEPEIPPELLRRTYRQMKIHPTFAQTVRAWRERHQLTLEAAAARLGVPYRTLQDWQAGRREPRGYARRALAARLKR